MRVKYEVPIVLLEELEDEDIVTRSGLEEIPETDESGEGDSDWDDTWW